MSDSVKIAVDLMGGENSPEKNLEGINLFVKKNTNKNDYYFYLYGDKNLIENKLKQFKYLNENNYKIFDTKIIVQMNFQQCLQLKKAKVPACGILFNLK
mgnify:CR=1 FL=1